MHLTIVPFLVALSAALPSPAENAAANCGLPCQIDNALGHRLSKGASIVHSSLAAPRWSDYDAPTPGTVVNVATEKDVQTTIQFCNTLNVPFLAQSGGSGWADTFTLNQRGLLINLRGLNAITFSPQKDLVTFGGGTLISEMVDAAYNNSTQVSTGNCVCVSVLGAALGGGYGRLMGLYGMSVDNLLSMSLVTAKGEALTVLPGDTELWWALRGAGANFGIVTSATMKAYPVPQEQNGAWLGPLVFTPDQIEPLIAAINDLQLTDQMSIFLYYTTIGPPEYKPVIISIPFYLGTEEEGRKAFASILDIGPVSETTAWTPYSKVNAGSESFCKAGGRKPSFAAGMQKLDPTTWRGIWDQYVAFLQSTPGARGTTVLMEYYPTRKAEEFGDASSSYAWRSQIKFNGVVNTNYVDPALDQVAIAFGSKVRDEWRVSGGAAGNATYINYANGDESLESIYGAANLPKLKELKTQYDPQGKFNQWFPLSPAAPAASA